MTKTAILIILLLASIFTASATVVSGSATVTVQNDNVKQADTSARNSALINALYNYFLRQQEMQPDMEIPDISTEFFKFIKSYKITDRRYNHGTISYSVIADIDKITLSDVTYMIKTVTSSAVFLVKNVDNSEMDVRIAEALKKNSFSTRYQQDFRASLDIEPTTEAALEAFKNTNAQYYFEITAEPVENQNKCTVALTAKVYGKTGDYNPLKTNGESTGDDERECTANAAGLAMAKLLGYVRENFIPLPEKSNELNKITVTASNYSNFATPKNIMEEMKKKTFITSYAVKGFAEKSLDMDVEMYISPDMLLSKLQAIAKQYGFTAYKNDAGNITLDFTGQE